MDGHGLGDLQDAIALYQDNNNNNNNNNTTNNNNNNSSKVTGKEEEAGNKNRVSNEVQTKKPQVVTDKDGMSEKKLSPTETSSRKGNLKKKKKATKKAKKDILKVDLRKLAREVEEQKQILKEHQRILNQLLIFYKSTKNRKITFEQQKM